MKSTYFLMLLLTIHGVRTLGQPKHISHPNILFIAVDDQKPLMRCYGDSTMHTPNFDRLAQMGTIFTNAHVQQAVCGPSRASVMTAAYPDRTKVWDLHTDFRESNPELISMPEYLIQQGYLSEALGKIYHYNSASPNHDGKSWTTPHFVKPDHYQPVYGTPPFAYWMDPNIETVRDSLFRQAEKTGIQESGKKMDFAMERFRPSTESVKGPDSLYPDGLIVNEAVRRINSLSQSAKPFFLATGFIKPHLPFNAPQKYWDLYKRDSISLAPFRKLGKDVPELTYHTLWEIGAYSDIDKSLPLGAELPVEKQKELIHGYMACVSYIDTQLGKLLDAVEANDLDDKTLIVLWGDHGYHLGDHTQWCKHTNLEQATRIPLMFAGPGVPAGLSINFPVELVDVFPTLFDLAGLSLPAQVQGESLVPLMQGRKEDLKQAFAVSQFHRGKQVMGYSIRSDRYRYTEWRKLEEPFREKGLLQPYEIIGKELYDYGSDPLETENLIDQEKFHAIQSEWQEKLNQHIISTHKAIPLKKKKVFLFAGQSNMDGRANADHLTEEEKIRLLKAGKRIEYHVNHLPVSPLQVTQAQAWHQKKYQLTHHFGPELFLGISLAESLPEEEFIFIKRALGGSSLYGCWNPEWEAAKAKLMNEEDRPQLYDDFIAYTKNILGKMDTSEYELSAMFWVQGETDSNTRNFGTEPAHSYGSHLEKLIRSVRKDLNAPGLPFIIFQVGHGKVVEGMQDVAEEMDRVHLIPQSDDPLSSDYFPKNPPPIGHYTYEGMNKISLRFFEVLKKYDY
jgi:arylsulfatase A-like enzyme